MRLTEYIQKGKHFSMLSDDVILNGIITSEPPDIIYSTLYDWKFSLEKIVQPSYHCIAK